MDRPLVQRNYFFRKYFLVKFFFKINIFSRSFDFRPQNRSQKRGKYRAQLLVMKLHFLQAPYELKNLVSSKVLLRILDIDNKEMIPELAFGKQFLI